METKKKQVTGTTQMTRLLSLLDEIVHNSRKYPHPSCVSLNSYNLSKSDNCTTHSECVNNSDKIVFVFPL